MELTLHHNNLSCYQLIGQRLHCQEETQEAIVPDACPDILRIIETCGQLHLRGKQCKDGVASATGIINATVLYQPEGESGLRRVEVQLPFDCQVPMAGLDPQGELVVTTQLKGIDTRILNPRKLLVRGEVALTVQAFMPQQYAFCHSVTAGDEAGIQQLECKQDAYCIMAVEGKAFTFTEQVRLAGQGEIGEVISVRALPTCTESKRIGNKLILKGELALGLLVQEPTGGLSVSEHQLPFSQILEVAGGGETGDCTVELEVVQLEVLTSHEGGKQLELQAELLAQAVVRGHCTVALLEDVYSTSWEMETEKTIHNLTTLVDSSSSTQNMRELLELSGSVRKIVDCWCRMGEIVQRREGDRLQLEVDLSVVLLYVDEAGSLQSSGHVVRGGISLDCQQNVTCHPRCRCPQEVFATPAAGGIEVRVALQFDYLLLRQREYPAILNTRLSEPRQRGEGSPSVVLRRGEQGETMWDLAKCYGTTREELMAANGLEESEGLPSGMLLIPSSR